MDGVVVVDSSTRLGPEARDAVVVCGSHGGLYSAWLAARAGVRAVVLNDAGIGRHQAGIAGLMWLAALGIPAVAMDHRSARIGDGADTLASGVASMANEVSARHGCLPGHTCAQVVRCLLENAEPAHADEVPPIGEARQRILNTGHREVWALDSISLAQAGDRRKVLVTGSHGGLLGGAADDGILEVDAFAALFNDAGGGKDDAGFARLGPLEARGMAAATVSAYSARIGDGRSTYETGVLSRVNEVARRLDLREGLTAREAVARLVGLA
jgi:hypothetical protein